MRQAINEGYWKGSNPKGYSKYKYKTNEAMNYSGNELKSFIDVFYSIGFIILSIKH